MERPTSDLAVVENVIDNAAASSGGCDIAAGATRAVEMLNDSNATRKQVHFVSDFQRHAWQESRTRLAEIFKVSDADVTVFLVPVANEPVNNVGVTDIRIPRTMIGVGRAVRCQATVRNFGPNRLQRVPVELWVEGRKVARKSVSLEANAQADVLFDYVFNRSGVFGIEVGLELDALPTDNRRSALVCVLEGVPVLIAEDAADNSSRPPASYYAEATISAIQEAQAAPDASGPERRPDAAMFDVRTTDATGLSTLNPDDFWVIILANVGPLPSECLDRLNSAVGFGTGALVAAGPDFAPNNFARDPCEWFPGLHGASVLRTDEPFGLTLPAAGQSRTVNLASPGMHTSLASLHFWNALSVREDSHDGVATDLRFSGGVPAVMIRQWHQGRVLFFNSTLDASWTDLVYRTAFVPLMHEWLTYLLEHRLVAQEMNPGGTWDLILTRSTASAARVLTAPNDEQLDFAAYVRSAEDSERILFRFAGTEAPGLYRIDGVPADARYAVAVNIETAESSQEILPPEQIASSFDGRGQGGVALCQVVSTGQPIEPYVRQYARGTELWQTLTYALLAFLLVESFLAYRFAGSVGRRDRAGPGNSS